MKKLNLSLSLVILAMWGCNDSEDIQKTPDAIKINVNVVSDLVTRSPASESENKVNAFDVFLFDVSSGLLEDIKLNVQATTPSNAGIPGESKVGEVTFKLKDDNLKNILMVANSTTNNVSYGTPEVGATSYSEMMRAVTKLTDESASPDAPFVMSGYMNNIKGDTGQEINISLQRRVSKISVRNLSENDITINSLQLKQVANQAYLFQKGNGEYDFKYVDYNPVNGNTTSFYVFPQPVEKNKIVLTVEGSIKGKPFSQSLDIQPKDVQGKAVDMKNNSHYTVKLSLEEEALTADISINAIEDWSDEEDIPGKIKEEEKPGNGLISFNGLQWMDRNLGATSSDFENDWENAIGSFYQWGRNVAFGISGFETVSGPLTLAEVESAENRVKFIKKMNGDWLSGTDNTRWQTAEKQPCPNGYRIPTIADLMGIFTQSGVLVNTINGPVEKTETLSNGSFPAQYWGDRSRTVYGIKKFGSNEAYFMKWEFLPTRNGKNYLKISKWNGDETSTFTGKTLHEVQMLFGSLPDDPEVITFPAAGNITGSNGNYSEGQPGGYYWSSSLNGSGAHRAEFTSGKMIAGDTYNSRVSGHSIRCIKY